jgi:hemolysin activation/secretion protein
MQALIQTFSGNSWWAGVIWTSDAPLAPRSSQVNWEEGTQWAGDNLQPYDATSNPHGTKAAGIWLAQATHKVPVPCLC